MNKLLLNGIAALAMTAVPAQAALLYAVDRGNNLVSFDSAAPGKTLSSVALGGVTGNTFLGLDFRPSTGILYGLSSDFRLLTINQVTGATSLVSSLALTGNRFAFDFNPTNNNLRIVSDLNTNYVFNFANNTLMPGINVAYGASDPISGTNPDIVAAGYTNNDQDIGTGTTLLVLDSLNDILATQDPTSGVLTTVGALTGIGPGGIGQDASVDILTLGSNNQAFVRDGNTLYSLNTNTGALTSLGNTAETFFGLAVAPVPEPAAWLMMIAGFGFVGGAMRRRRAEQHPAVAIA